MAPTKKFRERRPSSRISSNPLVKREKAFIFRLYSMIMCIFGAGLFGAFSRNKPAAVSSASLLLQVIFPGPDFAACVRRCGGPSIGLSIIDLGGDNLGARKTPNVFAIQIPVAIAIGMRGKSQKPETPADVWYIRSMRQHEKAS